MAKLSPIKFEMGYKIEFQTTIRDHHIYKDVWVPKFSSVGFSFLIILSNPEVSPMINTITYPDD